MNTDHSVDHHGWDLHTAPRGLEHVATFCGSCSCGCPQLHLDHGAPENQRVVLTDDFGQRVQMSLPQLRVLVDDVKTGALDGLFAPVSALR